jgi:hypothetical protein
VEHLESGESKIITHKNLNYWLKKVQGEPYFECGSTVKTPPAWCYQEVTLEFPLGELCKDGLTTIALVGREKPEPVPLTGKEQFNAQGLEGKIQVRKPLFNALMNLRDLLPELRGRILLD